MVYCDSVRRPVCGTYHRAAVSADLEHGICKSHRAEPEVGVSESGIHAGIGSSGNGDRICLFPVDGCPVRQSGRLVLDYMGTGAVRTGDLFYGSTVAKAAGRVRRISCGGQSCRG